MESRERARVRGTVQATLPTVKAPNFTVQEVISPSEEKISAPMVKVLVDIEKNGKKERAFKYF